MRRVIGIALASCLLFAGCGSGLRGSATSGSWEQLPNAPLSPRSSAVVVGVGELAVVVGGSEFLCPPNADCAWPGRPLLRDGAVYDSASDAWRPISPAPHGLRRGERATASLGGSAYLLSSCATGPDCDAPPHLLEYDVKADRWSDHGTPPGANRSYFSLIATGDQLVVLSSTDEHGERPDALYDPATGRWKALPDDPLPIVFDRTGVVMGDDLVVAGSVVADVEAGKEARKPVARLNLPTLEWTSLPDAPGPGYQLFPTDRGPLLNGHFIEAPGWMLDPEAWEWQQLPDQTGDQHDLRGVLGSEAATYEIPNSVGQMTTGQRVYVYDSEADGYLLVPSLSQGEHVHDDSSTAVGRSLFVFGGASWSDDYSPRGELTRGAWLWTPPASDL